MIKHHPILTRGTQIQKKSLKKSKQSPSLSAISKTIPAMHPAKANLLMERLKLFTKRKLGHSEKCIMINRKSKLESNKKLIIKEKGYDIVFPSTRLKGLHADKRILDLKMEWMPYQI
jgi:hypothetical protein